MSTIKIIKCLIASPGDVTQERDICETVFEELNRELGSVLNFRIESVRWEKDAHAGCGEYGQEVINRQIDDLYDLFLGIMYSRFGTPTPVAGSGTEEEFNIAYSKKQEGKVDDILFYFNSAPIPQSILDPDQYKKVNEFKKRLEELKIFYKSYDGTDAFRDFLRQELTLYFRQRFAKKKKNVKSNDKLSKNLMSQNEAIVSYRTVWKETIDLLYKGDKLDGVVKKIEKLKNKIPFVKAVYLQDNVIDQILRKKQLGKNEALLISWAIDECGLNPHYYSRLINDYEELNKLPLWSLLKEKEGTFNGKEAQLSGTDDELVYENIQRNLFHLNFKEANCIINKWKPSNYFIVIKAMRLAAQNDKRDKASKLLSDFIEKDDNLSTKLYAMQIANYISNRYPWPYDTEVLYQYGVDGIGDMLNFMIQQLRGKVEAPKSRGWIGTTMKFGGNHLEYEKSLRTLRFISDCGIYLNYGATCFFDKANWYLVFQNLYEVFPYPCFFYSLQYRDQDLLTRVGQDFAYSPKLCDFNQDILLRSIKAYSDEQTPSIFLTGLLYITGPIYFAVDENVWFEVFVENIFNELTDSIDKYDLSDALVKNVEYALNSICHYDHVNQIMISLMNHYSKNCRLVDYLIRRLHIKYLKDGVANDLRDTLKSLISDYPHIDITDLIFYLNQHNLITKEVLCLFIDKFKATEIEAISKNLVSLMYLCILTHSDANAFKKAKDIFLNQDIWYCGILNDGKGWSSPHYIRLAALKEQIVWSDGDFERIRTNLINNINLYDDAHTILHEESFMRNVQVSYLSDVLQFIDSLAPERKETLTDIRGKVEALLKERINYNTLIEGMLSEQSMDVSYVIDNVVQGIMANGVSAYIDEFNFILDRAITGDGLTLNKMLDGVRLVVRNKPDEVKSLGLCSKLNLLLSIYQKRWQDLKEFKPVWSFNYLYEIADFLKEQNCVENEAITYWLTDPFVQRFLRK